MGNQKISTYRSVFYLLLGFSLIFIITSLVLIYNVEHLRNDVEKNVTAISELTRIEHLSTDIETKDLKEYHARKAQINALELTSEEALSLKASINQIPFDESSLHEVENVFTALRQNSRTKIAGLRGALGSASEDLALYWWFSHVVIIVACLLTIFSAFLGYKFLRTKVDLKSEKGRKKEYFNLSHDAVITTDEDGKIDDINDAALELFGYSEKEIKKKGLHILYANSDDFFKVLKTIDQKGVFKGEIENKRKNGERFISFLSANALKDNKGNQIGTMGISRDITSQKNKEEQYKKLVKNTSLLIQTLDVDGNIIFVNATWERVLGYEIHEDEPFNIKSIIHPENKYKFQQVFEAVLDQQKIKEEDLNFDLVTVQNEIKSFEWNFNLDRDLKGNILSIQTFLKDITDKVKIKKELKQSEAIFRQITETINDVFYLYNVEEQKYEYISPNCEEVLGVKQSAILNNEPNKMTIHPDDLQLVKNAKVEVESGNAYEIEFRLIIGNQIRWINEKSFPIKDKFNNVIKNPGVCRDITQDKNALHLIQQKNKQINDSVEYARKIQKAAIPGSKELLKIFNDAFVFHKAKDTLTGDFYITSIIKTNDGIEMPVAVVADCTGHGIPGGILSLLCHALIRETFSNIKINSPADALNYVRERVTTLLNENFEEKSHIYDGMDVAFCVFNKEMTQLNFSGANTPCYIVRKDQTLVELKGDRQHIGYNTKPESFTNQSINLEKGDTIYLTTDGYMDQFGGEKEKKFMRKKFKRMLPELSQLPTEDQKRQLRKKHLEWKGEVPQTDDITVMGIRV